MRGGPGHTRFWFAYWVKETKHLIPTQAGDSVMGVHFVGFKATISMEPRGVATIGPIKFQVPEGYAFQGSGNEGDAVVGNWLDRPETLCRRVLHPEHGRRAYTRRAQRHGSDRGS